jgi:transcription-repair coupling factor (superfamily II helicase)
MLNDEINRRNDNNNIVEESVEENTNENKAFLNVTTHIDDSYVQEDDLKIEIHKIINSVDSREKFESVKLELEDRFGKISEDVIIYMYEEWFENLAKKLKVSNVHQNKNSIEIVFPGSVVSKFKVDEIFVDAYHVSNMFRFANKGSNLVIILDIIKLDKHPVYYLVELLDKIYFKFGKDID